ncbi:uncharacterized protein PG986_011372 [Apiospora aurea]|uniref:Uncharacterized protein n=1 Tax=Apiospora aurea TaxID=335848 RepID=A0ABR1Q5E5_9PEZI
MASEDSSTEELNHPDSNLPDQPVKPDPEWIDVDEILLWLSTCDRDHPACRRALPEESNEVLGRPVWLINVESGCIVPAESHEYLALSYVWGGAESGQLTTETLAALRLPGALGSHDRSDAVVVPKTIRHDAFLGAAKQLLSFFPGGAMVGTSGGIPGCRVVMAAKS